MVRQLWQKTRTCNHVGLPLEKLYGRHLHHKRKQALNARRNYQHERRHQLDTSCDPEAYSAHSSWSGCDTTSATFGHGKMYLTNMLNRVPEVQNLSTIVSDRDEMLLLMKLDMLDSDCFACSMGELRRIH